ncbi:MAG: heavy metal-associated domain-containing protein [Phycisphaerales bacterium]
MLRTISLAVLAASSVIALAASNLVAAPTGSPYVLVAADNVTLKYTVEGMHCDGCVQAITAKVKKVKGVVSCEVVLDKKTATIVVTDESVRKNVEEAITKLGYKITKA